MEEALRGIPVQIQGEGDDASEVESQIGGWRRVCRRMAMALGAMQLTHTGADCYGALWLPSRHHLVYLFSWKKWHIPHTKLGVLRHTTTVVKGKVVWQLVHAY